MNKEVCLSDSIFSKIHDNVGGVKGTIIFKNSFTVEEYQSLFRNNSFILCDKNYITNLQEENERLKNELEEETLNKEIAQGHRKQLQDIELQERKEIDKLNNIIKIMEKYFELIVDLGYDYDGLNKIEDLKTLIDELCRYASLGRVCNTTEPIFINNDKKYNILNEELKEGK